MTSHYSPENLPTYHIHADTHQVENPAHPHPAEPHEGHDTAYTAPVYSADNGYEAPGVGILDEQEHSDPGNSTNFQKKGDIFCVV